MEPTSLSSMNKLLQPFERSCTTLYYSTKDFGTVRYQAAQASFPAQRRNLSDSVVRLGLCRVFQAQAGSIKFGRSSSTDSTESHRNITIAYIITIVTRYSPSVLLYSDRRIVASTKSGLISLAPMPQPFSHLFPRM